MTLDGFGKGSLPCRSCRVAPQERIAANDADRIATLVNGYFGFARAHPDLWTPIYDHRLPAEASLSERDQQARGVLTEIVITEVAHAPDAPVAALARSLIATIHRHCAFALSGACALMGKAAPQIAALARVREALAGHARD